MKKKLVLLIAAMAMTGLSACNENNSTNDDCITDAQKCDANSVWICTDGAWVVEKACLSNEVCNATSYTCDAQAVVCEEGAKRCENNVIEVCDANAWTIQEACAEKTCDDASYTCIASVCDAGWQRCNGNVVEVCDADSTYQAVTPAACADGKLCLADAATHTATCVECTENSHCASNNCQADNTCGEGAACVEGTDADKCDGNTWMTCVETEWLEDVCAGATAHCDVTKGCVECTENSHCASNNCKADNTCGEGAACVEGVDADKCEGNTFSMCITDEWASEVCKDAKSHCLATKGCVECTENSHCASNNCKADNTCGEGAACVEGVDADKCEGNTFSMCITDEWASEVCKDAKSHCLATKGCVECTENSHCASNNCKADNTCGEGAACVEGTDADKCEGNTWTTCIDNEWVSDPCMGTKAVCSATEGCVECTEDNHCTTKNCNTTTNKCESPLDCTDGDKRCVDNKSHIGRIETCNIGLWGSSVTCKDDVSCSSLTTCGVCKNETTQCIDDEKEATCADGVWGAGVSCKYGCNFESDSCRINAPESSIDWCSNQYIDASAQKTYGRVLDPRSTKDASTITAAVLCGKATQMISEYVSIPGVHNAACGTDCGNNFEYVADLSSLGAGEYLCVWSFDVINEMPVACTNAGDTPIVDFDVVATSTIAQTYTVLEGGWDHLVTFDDCKADEGGGGYKTGTCTNVVYTKGIVPGGTELIDGSKALKIDKGKATITAPNGVGKLSVDIKKVNKNTSDITITVNGVSVITRTGVAENVLETMTNNAVNATGAVDIVISATERIVIDNLKWTNHP